VARGSKEKYTDKQKRQAEHIEEGYEDSGVSHEETERRAWATVNDRYGGGAKGGSGTTQPKKRSKKTLQARKRARAGATKRKAVGVERTKRSGSGGGTKRSTVARAGKKASDRGGRAKKRVAKKRVAKKRVAKKRVRARAANGAAETGAVALLEGQHRRLERLFEEFEQAQGVGAQQELFERIADHLAAHAAIEEELFYPTFFAARTEKLLRESVEEHLVIKRVLTDLLEMTAEDEQFRAKMKTVKDIVEHHVEEEESELFPKIARDDRSRLLGERMHSRFDELMNGVPRMAVPGQTTEAASLVTQRPFATDDTHARPGAA
jgi:hemerythrin superfamily protein